MSTNPFKDTNGDGVLDGAEIRAALRAEEEKGSERTANERAHGVLDTAGAAEMTSAMNRLLLEGQITTGAQHEQALKEAATILREQLLGIAETFAGQTDLVKNAERDFRKANPSMSQEQEAQLAVALADLRSTVAFADTFKKTFPKGIKIEAADMPEILGHFGPLMVPLTPQRKEPDSPVPPRQ